MNSKLYALLLGIIIITPPISSSEQKKTGPKLPFAKGGFTADLHKQTPKEHEYHAMTPRPWSRSEKFARMLHYVLCCGKPYYDEIE